MFAFFNAFVSADADPLAEMDRSRRKAARIVVLSLFLGFIGFLVSLSVVFVSFIVGVAFFGREICHEVFCTSGLFGEPTPEKLFEVSG